MESKVLLLLLFFLKEIAGEKWERREEFEEAEIWRKGE